MALTFEYGDPQAPKGHALVYYRSGDDPSQLLMTYIVVLPAAVDVSKYMPPFLMPHMGAVAPTELSCFAFPPLPEPIGSETPLESLARARGDDLLFGGTVSLSDVPGILTSVNEIVQSYAEAYTTYLPVSPSPAQEEATPALGVNEVLYGFMDQQEKLNELTRLVGKLSFAAGARDPSLLQEVEAEMRALGQYLPSEYRIHRILEVAIQPTAAGARLAQLYVERCYRLSREEYLELKALEEEIQTLEVDQDSA